MITALDGAKNQKELGTEALQEGDVPTAQARYEDAIKLLDTQNIDQTSPPGTGEEFKLLWNELRRTGAELDLACHLNLALCCIKRELWSKAVDAAGRAVQRDPNSVKGWFRRGIARAGGGHDEEAKGDLTKAAKLAPKDGAIRKELTAVKNRLSALKEGEGGQKESAAVAAAMLGSGGIYKEETTTGMENIDKMVLEAEKILSAGHPEEAISVLKNIFKLIWDEECVTAEIAYRQRFSVHSLSGRCHMLNARKAQDAEAKASLISRAVADLQKAVSMLEEADAKGRGVGSVPTEWAVATGKEAAKVGPLLVEAKELALQFPAKEGIVQMK